jgi:tetratricopeptide (TPR) repeat protein
MKPPTTPLRIFTLFVFALSAYSQASQDIRYNFEYSCNKERIVVGHCRHDSDMAGYPRTKPEDDYCQVYYPDRPKMGGFEAFATVLRADIIKTLNACGAFEVEEPSGGSGDGDSADAYYEQGLAQAKAKQYDTAIESFKRSIAATPSSAAYNDLGLAYADLKRYPEAAAAVQKAVALKPNNYTARLNLGNILIEAKRYDEGIATLRELVRLEPDNVKAVFLIGLAYFRQEKYPECATALKEAVRLSPDNIGYVYSLGIAYARMGRKDDAHKIYQQLLGVDRAKATDLYGEIYKPAASPSTTAKSDGPTVARPGDSLVKQHLEQGEKYFDAGEYLKAIPEYQAALAQKPDKEKTAALYHFIGDSYFLLRQYDRAILNLLQSNKLVPNSYGVQYTLGGAYTNSHQYPNAVLAYKEAVRLKPADADVRFYLGEAYLLTNRKAEAMQIYQDLMKIDATQAGYLKDLIDDKTGPVAVLIRRGQLALLGHDDEEAAEAYRNALALKPTNPDVLMDIGFGFHLSDKYNEALALFGRMLTMKLNQEQKASLHDHIGSTYLDMKQYAKALPELLEASRIKPNEYYSKETGMAYRGLGQNEKAIAAFQEAIKINPKFDDGYIELARTFGLQKRFEEGSAAARDGLKIKPDSFILLNELGIAYYNLKQYPNAIAALRQAIRLYKGYGEAHFYLGKTFNAMGRKRDAMQVYAALKPLDAKFAQQLFDDINKK